MQQRVGSIHNAPPFEMAAYKEHGADTCDPSSSADSSLSQPKVTVNIRIVEPRVSYELDQSDIVRVATLFGPVFEAYVSPEKHSAEVSFHNVADANSLLVELDGFVINGIGTVSAHIVPNATPPATNLKPEADEGQHAQLDYRCCRFELITLFRHQPEDNDLTNPKTFHVVSKILGANNQNINYILDKSKTRDSSSPTVTIQIDGVPRDDAPVNERLHVTVSGFDTHQYKESVKNIEQLLGSVCQEFVEFCRGNGYLIPSDVSYRKHTYRAKGPNDVMEYVRSVDPVCTWLGQSNPMAQEGTTGDETVEREQPPPGSMYGSSSEVNAGRNRQNFPSGVSMGRENRDVRPKSVTPMYFNNNRIGLDSQGSKADGSGFPHGEVGCVDERNPHFNSKENRDRRMVNDGRRGMRGNSSGRGGIFRDRDRGSDMPSRSSQM